MRRIVLLALGVLIPTTLFALDLTGTSLPYKDVTHGTPEAAGISLLTHEGVLQGYADGTFRPRTLLNRAEFLKIVLESRYVMFASSYSAPETRCFPDVEIDAWYTAYVCFARDEGLVSGFPIDDIPASFWKFHPERSVTYAEALKILSRLYRYDMTTQTDDEWYTPYLRAAISRGTALSIGTELGTAITRGQMARLTAAYLSESKDLLDEYRASERGEYVVVPSSSSSSTSSQSSSESSVSSSSSSSVASSSSSSAPRPLFTLPVQHHFLIVGTTSDAVASGRIYPDETSEILGVEVKLYNEVSSIEALEVTTTGGTLVATLLQRTTGNTPDYKQIYEVQMEVGKGYLVAGTNEGLQLVLRAKVRSIDNKGVADQYFDIRSWNITLQGKTSNTTKSVSIPVPFPPHQTAFAHITSVRSLSAATGSLSTGAGMNLGTFSFSGSHIPGKTITIDNLLFTLEKTVGVNVGNFKLVAKGWEFIPHACTLNLTTVSCTNLPTHMHALSDGVGLALQLIADIDVASTSTQNILQVKLNESGSPSELGSVQWSDGSGHYRWVEGASPVAEGTRFTQE